MNLLKLLSIEQNIGNFKIAISSISIFKSNFFVLHYLYRIGVKKKRQNTIETKGAKIILLIPRNKKYSIRNDMYKY